jgi:hypothetical protein
MGGIDAIEELLKPYPALTHLQMDNGSEFIARPLQEWCQGNGPGMGVTSPRSTLD